MKEKPITFIAPMVRAILEGRKTQTRRIMKIQPPDEGCQLATCVSTTGPKREIGQHHWVKIEGDGFKYVDGSQPYFSCPYSVGQIAWVKETFEFNPGGSIYDAAGGIMDSIDDEIVYRADRPNRVTKWNPSIHMPRWASRITLEITGVRVERLQDISGKDCWAEGIECAGWDSEKYGSVTHCYRDLWESINGPGAWKKNHWVWVVEFKRVEDTK